jgi:hypothetical protein
MKIRRATFLGVRGVADAAYDFVNPRTGLPHDFIVVTGPAASGKTRLLEAIVAAKEALGPYGPPLPGAQWIQPDGILSKIVLTLHLDEEEQMYAGASSAVVEGEASFFPQRARGEVDEGVVALLQRYKHDGSSKLEYFPATRRIPPLGPIHGLGEAEQRLHRASKDARKYGFIQRFLKQLEMEPSRSRAFAEKLAALSSTCRHEPGAPSDGVARCLSSRGGPLVSANELSDAEADAVVLAATAVAIGLSRSLVLIDRPELYTDAADTPRLLSGLQALGEGNQVIVASSSPALLAAARDALVVRLGEA